MTTSYPDQAGEIIFSLLQSLGDAFSRLLLSFELDRGNLRQSKIIVAAYTEALERVLGAPSGSIEIIDDATQKEWFLSASDLDLGGPASEVIEVPESSRAG
jgi:phenylpyruvate tautomerase PptA (4-oxalocrotonate tautomerase family)